MVRGGGGLKRLVSSSVACGPRAFKMASPIIQNVRTLPNLSPAAGSDNSSGWNHPMRVVPF